MNSTKTYTHKITKAIRSTARPGAQYHGTQKKDRPIGKEKHAAQDCDQKSDPNC